MTFTKYIYSILLAVTIGLLLLFFVPALKDEKNDKIVYNYEVSNYEVTFGEDFNLSSLNGDKQYIIYLSIYYQYGGLNEYHNFMFSLNFSRYESQGNEVDMFLIISFEQEIHDFSLSISFYSLNSSLLSTTINYKVLIIEVVS